MEHSLHTVGESLFMLTLAVCATYFFVSFLHKPPMGEAHTLKAGSLPNWVMFLSAFLPALGAAMSGIRVQGEFASTAERSEAMAARLTQLQLEIQADEKIGETGLARLRSFIETTSETMLIEVVDWKFVFRGKPLSLPA
jgi:hypothetical protein